mgnify:FL=1
MTTQDDQANACRRGAKCLAIDLEVGRDSGRIHQLAGVRGDSGETVVFPGAGCA